MCIICLPLTSLVPLFFFLFFPFSHGPVTYSRILLSSSHSLVPGIVQFLLLIFGAEEHAWLYETAVMLYQKVRGTAVVERLH